MKRIYSLDVLRIIAAVLIIFHHYQQITGAFFAGKLNFCNGEFSFGYVVEFFFVLSGFLAYKYVEKEDLTFPEFYIPKMKRLLPLVFISSVVYEVFLIMYKRAGAGVPWMLGTEGTVWGVIVNALGIQSSWSFENLYVNNPVWYVGSLLLCQTIFFFLIYISRRKEIPIIYLFIIMIFIGAGVQDYHLYLPFLNESAARGYCAFFFGLVFAYFVKGKEITWKYSVISLALVAGITYGMVNHYNYFEKGIQYIMAFIYYPALIVLFTWGPIKKMLNYKFIGILGEITYDMYVWHVPMLLLLYVILAKNPGVINIYARGTMFGFAGVMFVVGIISHYLIDRPIQKLFKTRKKQQ